jgi:hypothetical protein
MAADGGRGPLPPPEQRPEPGVDPERPYRARGLSQYRRGDAGLFDSGLTGRYPGLRGSGARDARIRSTGPGPGSGGSPEPASMLTGRTALVATIVAGQLWALTVALNAWLEHDMTQVWLLLGFNVLSFALAVAVWLAAPTDR